MTEDLRQFLIRVDESEFMEASQTSIASGIAACSEQLASNADNPTELVLLGDGKGAAGKGPVLAAKRFREQFGSNARIHTVSVGLSDTAQLEQIASIGGGSSFSVDQLFEVVDVIVERVFECEYAV
ncbi:von Willebrand factor A-like protein [Gracilaria domingensis]|nr:von Willebrand factor A-like protein [Gracilaria domingensis]